MTARSKHDEIRLHLLLLQKENMRFLEADRGTLCYLATEQEMHRAKYMNDVMFKDLFDGSFVTAEIGLRKSNPEFFKVVIDRLSARIDNLKPEEIVFFDDSQSKVNSAAKAGIIAHLFTGVGSVRKELA